MYKIATLNKISHVGLNKLDDKYTLVDEVENAHGIIVRSQNMKDMKFSENLLAIARAGAGVNNIPLDRCADEGIAVFNTPGANANAVKELVLGALFLAARNLPSGINWAAGLTEDIAKSVEKGKGQFAGREITGKTLGVIGLGAIGVLVANTARRLGMNVIGYDPFITLKSAHELSNMIPVYTDLAELLPKCDYVTLHVPVLESTEGMMDTRRFSQMKNDGVLLNFSREKLVNESALLSALENNEIDQYITDFPTEGLIGKDKITLIPHLGASTKEAEDNCAVMAAEELMEYIEKGNIVNSVNFPTCSMGELNPEAQVRVCIMNKNIPSMLGRITGIMSDLNINIRDLTNKSKGEYAYTMMDIDGDVSEEELRHALDIEGIIRVRVINYK
ncbi:MAG: phosphoglycerate dehydrogenase [Anaerovoracaceae bacterium]